MSPDEFYLGIASNDEKVRLEAQAELAGPNPLNPRQSILIFCVHEHWRACTFLWRRDLLAEIRRRRREDPRFDGQLIEAFGVHPVHVEKWLDGIQGHNDLVKAITAAVLVGRNGIDFAPLIVRPVISFAFALRGAVQCIRANTHPDARRVRRSAEGLTFCFDKVPFSDERAANELTIQQAAVLFVLCVDELLHKSFAQAIVKNDDAAFDKVTCQAIEESRQLFSGYKDVESGFAVLAANADYRKRFVRKTCNLFHWAGYVAYAAIEPYLDKVQIPGTRL